MDTLERDFYEERRRKWRRSAFWRGFLVAIGIFVLIGVLGAALGGGPFGPHIARLELTGTIFEDAARERLIRQLGEDDDVRAVVVRINSPGGTSAGAEGVYEALRVVAAEKPVVAVMGEVAASGGYIAALSADHIIARGNTLTGSIGVIMEYPDVTDLLTRVGVTFETFRSSELKAEPSPVRKITPEARARQEALIADSYEWFRDLVGTRRGLDGAALDQVANGTVFTGRTALDTGLIDALGGEREAIAWLEDRDPALKDLDIETWAVARDEGLMGELLGTSALQRTALQDWFGRQSPRLLAILN